MVNLIPKGMYCYTGWDETVSPARSYGLCPYWSRRDDKPAQENGYCEYLQQGDWESKGLSLLWDQVKECGENYEDDLEIPYESQG